MEVETAWRSVRNIQRLKTEWRHPVNHNDVQHSLHSCVCTFHNGTDSLDAEIYKD